MRLATRTLLRSSSGLAIALGAGVALSAPAAAQLLVVSQNNAKILEYDENDGSFVRTFVEAVEVGFQNPGGAAIHPGNGALYVTSTGSGEIWEYDVGTGDAVISAAASVLIQPAAAAFDASGSTLYFVAANNDLSIHQRRHQGAHHQFRKRLDRHHGRVGELSPRSSSTARSSSQPTR